MTDNNAHLRQLTDQVVTFRVGDQAFRVTLYDNAAAADLLAQIPITAKASDYPGIWTSA